MESAPAAVRPWKVVYLEVVPPETAALIASCVPPGFALDFVRDSSDEAACEALARADFALVATHPLPSRVIEAGRSLRLIQHQGVGCDKTDLGAARALGIPVALCPEGTTIGVAEHTILLILAVYRRLLIADSSLRAGEWRQFSLRAGSFELAGKTIGLVGCGRIGQAVAARARAFEARAIYCNIARLPAATEERLGLTFYPFEELLGRSDIVSLHVPATRETRHIIRAETLALMRRGSVLINTARGPLVDQAALVAALTGGRLLGAGLDVFEAEPPDPADPLLALPNVVLTPHIAAGTQDALLTKMRACFANMVRVVRGEQPINVAN